MKKHLIATGLMLAVFAGAALAAESVKSGPQVGQKVPGPFEPLNINGESANKKNCLYCQFGNAPVVMVFARDVTPAVTTLIKKLDTCNEENKASEMGTCVIFCSDDKGLETKLQNLVKETKLKKTVLAIDNPAGPEEYKIAKDADVTVLVYKERKVTANLTFTKGQMKDKDIDTVLAEVAKLTAK